MDTVTIVSVIIAIVGIVLQLIDAFPTHREARRSVATVAVGIFLGVAASSFSRAQYNISGNIDRQFVLLFALLAVTVVFGLLAALLGDPKRRDAAGMIGLCFGLVFLAAGAMVAAGASPAQDQPKFSTDELLLVAGRAEQQGKPDVAIAHLERLATQLASSEARAQVRQRIRKLEQAQAGTSQR
ncbi:MAG TPA: hypothetical protein VF638_05510 [Sphingomonas sp.]